MSSKNFKTLDNKQHFNQKFETVLGHYRQNFPSIPEKTRLKCNLWLIPDLAPKHFKSQNVKQITNATDRIERTLHLEGPFELMGQD